MESIDQLLHDFASGDADRNWIVAQLADSDDQRVVSLFLRTLEDTSEQDVVRIEILKHLVLRRNDSNNIRQRIAEAILYIVWNDTDDLVRQHAANALRDYVDVSGVIECLESLVRKETEDIDVRHNAPTAIEASPSLPICREALRRLVSVPELGRSARRTLDGL